MGQADPPGLPVYPQDGSINLLPRGEPLIAVSDPGDRATFDAHEGCDSAANVAEGAKTGGVLNHAGEDVSRPQVVQEIVQGLGLGRPPGEEDRARRWEVT